MDSNSLVMVTSNNSHLEVLMPIPWEVSLVLRVVSRLSLKFNLNMEDSNLLNLSIKLSNNNRQTLPEAQELTIMDL